MGGAGGGAGPGEGLGLPVQEYGDCAEANLHMLGDVALTSLQDPRGRALAAASLRGPKAKGPAAQRRTGQRKVPK